jgi:hypothetical protein
MTDTPLPDERAEQYRPDDERHDLLLLPGKFEHFPPDTYPATLFHFRFRNMNQLCPHHNHFFSSQNGRDHGLKA